MADSKKLTAFCLKFTALIGLAIFSYLTILYVCLITGKDKYIAVIVDKIRILENVTSPKIIFVGGSNLAYGLNTARVRQAFAMPVVNMGLQAALGLKFILDQDRPYLNKGDIVVVVPEYRLFYDYYYGDPVNLIEIAALTHNWSALADYSYFTIIDSLLKSNVVIFSYSKRSTILFWFTQL